MSLSEPFGLDGTRGLALTLGARAAVARPSGALWLPDDDLLVVADLHLGKSERMARRGGPLLPPYDTTETLRRLITEIDALNPSGVVSLGDGFDDVAAARSLSPSDAARLAEAQRGAAWIWLAGNHDARPIGPTRDGVTWAEELTLDGLTLRHIADAHAAAAASFEVSGHYHPKATLAARGRRLTRRCFLLDDRRLILPAFGCYTGGLDARDPAFDPLLGDDARALLCGTRSVAPALRRELAGRAA